MLSGYSIIIPDIVLLYLHAVDGGRVAEAVLQLHPTLYNARTEQVWILKLGVLS